MVFPDATGVLTKPDGRSNEFWQAVDAVLLCEWSNGQTEGQITKVKLLKRQMYGRASVRLLRQRLLHAT